MNRLVVVHILEGQAFLTLRLHCLQFIYGKMRECDIWRDASEQEFENAKEGMEKLVMNRLFHQ